MKSVLMVSFAFFVFGNAFGSGKTTNLKNIESVICKQDHVLAEDENQPDGSSVSLNRCSFEIKKSSSGYDVTFRINRGVYHSGISDLKFQPVEAVKIQARNCVYSTKSPTVFACDLDGGHHQLKSTIEKTSTGSFYNGIYYLHEFENMSLTLEMPNRPLSENEFNKIKDCMPERASTQLLIFQMEPTDQLVQRCIIK